MGSVRGGGWVTRSGTALYESKNKYHELSGVYLRTRTPCKRRKGTWRLLGTKVTGGAKPGRAEPLASCRYLVRTARGVIKAEQKLRHNEWWKVTRKRNLYQARGVILSQTIGPNQSPAKLLPVAVAGIPIAGNYRINVPPGLDIPAPLGLRSHDIMVIAATITS